MNDLSTDFSDATPVEEGRGWTDARKEDVKMMVGLGYSASMIAGKLGHGISRNAVIGIIHRMGLAGRGTPTITNHGKPREPRPSRAKGEVAAPAVTLVTKPEPKAKVLPIRPVAPPPPVPTGPGISFMELTATTCKYPNEHDVGHPDFAFCGAEKPADGGPYCATHAKIAFNGFGFMTTRKTGMRIGPARAVVR